ncbi:MAG: RDD family protein [Rhodovibrionaceae bacterium]
MRLDISQVSPWAGFWRRAGAALIDLAIICLPLYLIVLYLFGQAFEFHGPGMGHGTPVALPAQMTPQGPALFRIHVADAPYFSLVLAAVFLIYKTAFEASRLMATPGKLALAIRVMTADGAPAPWPRALLRTWPWWLGAVTAALAATLGIWALESLVDLLRFIAVAMIAFTPHKQGLHDYMARAYVVRAGARPAR